MQRRTYQDTGVAWVVFTFAALGFWWCVLYGVWCWVTM